LADGDLAQIAMSVLRIYMPLAGPTERCEWALIEDGKLPVGGEGLLTDLPRHATGTELIVPATDVLLARTSLPPGLKKPSGQVLAFALEEKTATEPDTNLVIHLGSADDDAAMAVIDKTAMARWHEALAAVGIAAYDVYCETLMLPLQDDGWSVFWNGQQGFVRTARFEGGATDRGSRSTPPVSLSLMLESSRRNATPPGKITVYPSTSDAAPDATQWHHQLGVPVTVGAPLDWRMNATNAESRLIRTQRRWNTDRALWARLRPAAWIILTAFSVHLLASGLDWMLLAGSQRSLRNDMETRFRALFPDSVAVVDPALQMRRKLTEARHAAGLADSTDFLPLLEKATPALKSLPSEALRIMTYEQGRLTIELRAPDAGAIQRLINDLQRAGLVVDIPANASKSGLTTTTISMRES